VIPRAINPHWLIQLHGPHVREGKGYAPPGKFKCDDGTVRCKDEIRLELRGAEKLLDATGAGAVPTDLDDYLDEVLRVVRPLAGSHNVPDSEAASVKVVRGQQVRGEEQRKA
jgi:hypothetical protein